jgi:hypothetical protein
MVAVRLPSLGVHMRWTHVAHALNEVARFVAVRVAPSGACVHQRVVTPGLRALPLCIDCCCHEATVRGNFIHRAIAVQIQSQWVSMLGHGGPRSGGLKCGELRRVCFYASAGLCKSSTRQSSPAWMPQASLVTKLRHLDDGGLKAAPARPPYIQDKFLQLLVGLGFVGNHAWFGSRILIWESFCF